MRAIRWAVLIVVLIWTLDLLAQAWGAAYKGVVVEAETSRPIEGAVVIVVWWKKPFITMNGPQYPHKVKEEQTGAEGTFSIDASPGIDWNPFTYVLREPTVAIYYPGYMPFPRAHGAIGIDQTIDAMLTKEGAVVKLPRLKTREELLEFVDPSSINLGSLPNYRMPKLIRLINGQRQRFGLAPFPLQ